MRLIVLAALLALLGSAAHAVPTPVDFATVSMTTLGEPRTVTDTLCVSDGRDLVCDRGAQLLSNGVISTTGLTVNGVSITGSGGSASPTNVPAFSAYLSSGNQSIGAAWTKIPFNSEEFDTLNNYDNVSTYQFRPTVPGRYQVNVSVSCDGQYCYAGVAKNGTLMVSGLGGSQSGHVSMIVDMNGTTDYIEGRAYNNGSIVYAGIGTRMSASLLASGNGLISGTTGVGASKLASLTDVSLSNVTGMDILRFNGVSWTNVNVQNAISTTTMVTGWPDAIRCTASGGQTRVLYLAASPAGNGLYYYVDPVYDAADILIAYTSAGTFHSQGAAFDSSSSCYNRSISTLYAEGKAFNFIGGSGTGTALGDRITSGTASGVVAMAGGTISFTTGSTSGTAYLDTLGRFIGAGVSTTGAISATSIYAGNSLQLASPSSVTACNSSSIGAIRYAGGDFSFCRNGSAWEPLSSLGGSASKLASLTDVVTSGAVSGSVLAFNAATSSWTALPIQQVMSTTTMRAGFPDALVCVDTGGSPAPTGRVSIMHFDYVEASTGTATYRALAAMPSGGHDSLTWNPNGTYNSKYQSGVSDTRDCEGQSISALYAAGKAFNYIGSANGNSALGDRITSGTSAVVVNSATGIVSISQLGAVTSYVHPSLGYVGPGVSATGTVSGSKVATNVVKFSGATGSCATAADEGTFFYDIARKRLQVCSLRN